MSRWMTNAAIASVLALWAAGSGRAATVRVGLVVDAPSVLVGEAGDALIVEADGEAGARRTRTGPLRFGPRAGAAAGKASWDVRVAVEGARRKADLVRNALDSSLRAPLRVERMGSSFVVFAGPFDEESKARAVLRELDEAGMTDAELVKTEPQAASGSRLVMLTAAWEVVPLPSERVSVSPADGSPISVDGKRYRGELDVFVNEQGLVTVASVMDLEDYLRGVVPAEMGPEVYPALEALKAQAIAARTYALMPPAHSAQGFDRCAGPHCQVHGGVAAEHDLTDRAVRETGGLVATYEGRPIHAYFSSTCGGHTEDVTNVFADEAVPYLRGVPCHAEKVDFLRVPGRELPVDFSRVDGRTAHGVLARLLAAGVVTEEEARLGVFTRRAKDDEAAAWLSRAAAVAGLALDPGAMQSVSVETALAFVRSVLRATGTTRQLKMIAPQDLAAAARFRELQGLSGDDLGLALLALKSGLLPEGLDPGWFSSRLSRGNVLEMLEGWLKAQGHLVPEPARYVSAKGGALQVLQKGEIDPVQVAPGVLLLSGRPSAPSRLRDAIELKLGDKLRIHRDSAGLARCIEVEEDPDGAAFDRTSAWSWWTRRVSREQLAKNAAAAGVSDLREIRVTRTSAAGRVIGLELTDAAGAKTTVSGFACRQILGLPDLRSDVVVQRRADGSLDGVTATGRGWGHGVGLCQVGAFGMALSGRNAGAILEHYYPGTSLEPLPQ